MNPYSASGTAAMTVRPPGVCHAIVWISIKRTNAMQTNLDVGGITIMANANWLVKRQLRNQLAAVNIASGRKPKMHVCLIMTNIVADWVKGVVVNPYSASGGARKCFLVRTICC